MEHYVDVVLSLHLLLNEQESKPDPFTCFKCVFKPQYLAHISVGYETKTQTHLKVSVGRETELQSLVGASD